MEAWDDLNCYSRAETSEYSSNSTENLSSESSSSTSGLTKGLRSRKEIMSQLEARYVELLKQRDEKILREEAPHLLYPCVKCLHCKARDNDSAPPYVCDNKLISGFDKPHYLGWATSEIDGNLPHLCGLEKALWEPDTILYRLWRPFKHMILYARGYYRGL